MDPQGVRCCIGGTVAAVMLLLACRGPAPLSGPAGRTPARSGDTAAYEVVDLGTLGGRCSSAQCTYAADVNARGQVVGVSVTASGDRHAFLWRDGIMTDIGTLGGSWSVASAINGSGHIAGISVAASGETHVFLHSNGTLLDLGPALSWTSVRLNNRGQVAWTAPMPDGTRHAVLWTDGVRLDLGALGDTGSSTAHGLDDLGRVVGGSNERPFLWQAGVMRELPSLGGPAWASDLNGRGQVVGTSYGHRPPQRSAPAHALVWEGDRTVSVGRLPEDSFSSGVLINDAGQVVAHSYPFSWYPPRSFLWQGGDVTRLTTAYQYYEIRAMNDGGVLVGEQRLGNRDQRAVIWERGVATLLPLVEGTAHSSATAVSNTGEVVGWARTDGWPSRWHAVLWRKATAAPPVM